MSDVDDSRVDAALERLKKQADQERAALQAALDSSLDAADRIIMRKAADATIRIAQSSDPI